MTGLLFGRFKRGNWRPRGRLEEKKRSRLGFSRSFVLFSLTGLSFFEGALLCGDFQWKPKGNPLCCGDLSRQKTHPYIENAS